MRWWWRVMLALVASIVATGVTEARESERGWAYLVEKLVHDGVPRDRVLQVFRDDRVDPFDGLHFSLEPRESPSLYRHLRTRVTASKAARCLAEYDDAFEAAERTYGVPSNVVASIIQVESGCGANTGRSRILPALARLAMAAEPENLADNVDRLTLIHASRPSGAVADFAGWRAQHLEDMFYPEVKATFDIAERMHVDPLDIRGSGSGAFGIPQFLPRSYLWFGVDGDHDGRVSLYEPSDAIPSCARYLQHYGWKDGLSRAGQRNVIWGYNHSDAYIDTVLWVADEVRSPTPAPTRVAKRGTTHRTTSRGRRLTANRHSSSSKHRGH